MAGRIGTYKAEFVPNPMQRGFIESRAEADLFSSRMGEGKSAGLCWSIFYHTRHNPGAEWALVRDTWENLRATTLKEFFKWFPSGIMGQWVAGDKEFRWAEGVAKGTVSFLGMDSPDDASKLQSRELAGIAMDEPAPAASVGGIDEMIFNVGLSRLRQPDMKWYAVKLAQNNSDESHWTYKRFVDPGEEGFSVWQPQRPENERNLPSDYYAKLMRHWAGKTDLQARFIEGKFGFQQTGLAVTEEWNDFVHLASGLYANRGQELVLLWDFGLNPTCLITQRTPMGHWNILHAFVGDGIGVDQLIEAEVKPCIVDNYRGFRWWHCGDPAGKSREQSDSTKSAVKTIQRLLGGYWRNGPVRWDLRKEPAKTILRQMIGGKGLVQVDRRNAKALWYALRGGWHYHVARTGVVSAEPEKDIHSHPGDAFAYGAAVLYPTGKLLLPRTGLVRPRPLNTWSSDPGPDVGGMNATGPLGFERPGVRVPPEARTLGGR